MGAMLVFLGMIAAWLQAVNAVSSNLPTRLLVVLGHYLWTSNGRPVLTVHSAAVPYCVSS